jgi:hypothetical protein
LKNRSSKHEKRRALTRDEIKEFYNERDLIDECGPGLEERKKVLSMVVNSMARTANPSAKTSRETSIVPALESPLSKKSRQFKSMTNVRSKFRSFQRKPSLV